MAVYFVESRLRQSQAIAPAVKGQCTLVSECLEVISKPLILRVRRDEPLAPGWQDSCKVAEVGGFTFAEILS